jgi:hypothetical protein
MSSFIIELWRGKAIFAQVFVISLSSQTVSYADTPTRGTRSNGLKHSKFSPRQTKNKLRCAA